MNYIFDLDGTLIDSAPDIALSLNKLLIELDLAKIPLSIARSFIGNGPRKLIDRAGIYLNHPFSEDELDELHQRYVEIYRQNLVIDTVFYEGVETTLNSLKDQGNRLFVCTNKPFQPSVEILDKMGYLDFFEEVVGGDSFAEKKPSPLPLLKIMEKHKLSSADTWMIGDTIYDIEAGKKAGMKTILLPYGYNKRPIDELNADHICEAFSDILTVMPSM